MRNTTFWIEDLTKRLQEAAKGRKVGDLENRDACNRLCRVELGLRVLERIEEPDARRLFRHLPRFTQPPACADQHVLLARVQHILHAWTQYRWHKAVEWYQNLPSSVRLYSLKQDGTWNLKRLNSLIYPDRLDYYDRALSEVPPHSPHQRMAEPDVPHFFNSADSDKDNENWTEVTFPASLLEAVERDDRKEPNTFEGRKPIRVSLEDLKATAAFMDERDSTGKWCKRLDDLELRYFNDLDAVPETITLDGMHHVLGMVSSGKSTLMDILSVHVARQVSPELRVTLVVDSVTDVMKRVSLFRQLGLVAAPLLGTSELARDRHVQTLSKAAHVRVQEEGAPWIVDPLLDWRNEACLIRGGLLDGPEPAALRQGKYPCRDLYTKRKMTSKNRRSCPLLDVCPYRSMEQAIPGARILVATIQSLVSTEAPKVAGGGSMRLLEWIWRNMDLVIVDEADKVQTALDEIFTPSDDLLTSREDGSLDRLEREAPGMFARGRMDYDSSGYGDWQSNQRKCQDAADRVRNLLRKETVLQEHAGRHWHGGRDGMFSALNLFDRIWRDLYPDSEESTLPQAVQEFLRDPVSAGADGDLVILLRNLARLLMDDLGDIEASQMCLKNLAMNADPDLRRELDGPFRLAVLTAILDHRLKRVVDLWPDGMITDGYDMERRRRPPRDYDGIVPEMPMGNLFNFRWMTQGSEDSLQYIRCAGIGRWLLIHMHDWLEALDSPRRGPHVLLMSGTSWAPGSSMWHVEVEPDLALMAPKSKLDWVVRESKFSLVMVEGEWDGGMIRVSGTVEPQGNRQTGKGRKRRNLEELVRKLAKSESLDDPQMVQELKALDSDRKRILLATMSYDQAEWAQLELDRINTWRDCATRLVRDRDQIDHEDRSMIPRGQVERFADWDRTVLVAPMAAIGRAHNILNDKGYAAIGSVYFLVRPMPVPRDIQNAARQVVAWGLKNRPPAGVADGNWRNYRAEAGKKWRDALRGNQYYSSLSEEERDDLAMTQLVVLLQTAGRVIRGSVPARIHFCDAAFAPETASGRPDSVRTSLLVAMHNALQQMLQYPAGKLLYGWLAPQMESLISEHIRTE